MKRTVIATLLCLGGIVFLQAQGVKLGAKVEFANYFLQQSATTLDGTTEWSEFTTRTSPWYTGATFGREDLIFSYSSDSWNWGTTMRFDQSTTSSLADLKDAHLSLTVDDGQWKFGIGVYQDESLGYGIRDLKGLPMARYLAGKNSNTNYLFDSATDGRYLTTAEWSPSEIEGLSVLVGLPIEPNDMMPSQSTTDSNPNYLLTSTLQRARGGVKYALPDGGVIKATYQNSLFSNLATSITTDAFYRHNVTDYAAGLHEAFVGVDDLPLAENLTFKGGYQGQIDLAVSSAAQRHKAIGEVEWALDENWKLAVQDEFVAVSSQWANANFLPGSEAQTSRVYPSMNGYALFTKAFAKASYTVDTVEYSMAVNGGFQFAGNGQLHTYGMTYAKPVNNGSDGTAFSVGASPAVGLIFGEGKASVGVDLQFTSNTGASGVTNSAFGWRIPVTYALEF